MALLFMDSFDHYVTADIVEKWTSVGSNTIIPTGGRRGSGCLRGPGGAGTALKGVPASGNIGIVGFAYKTTALGSLQRFTGFHDAPNNRDHIYVSVNSDGSISVTRSNTTGPAASGGTVLGTSVAGIISINNFYYIECKVLLSATVGTVTIRVNGIQVLNLTNQNTIHTAGATTYSSIWLSGLAGGIPNTDFDDLYVLDGSGSAPYNDFLGDVRVDACLPTGVGWANGFSPSAGANWQCVDDATPNDDTDYNWTPNTGITDLFVTQDAPVAGASVLGVQVNISAKKMDAGVCTVAPVVRTGGADVAGTAQGPTTVYTYLSQPYQINPVTSTPWTEATFNSSEFGYRRIT